MSSSNVFSEFVRARLFDMDYGETKEEDVPWSYIGSHVHNSKCNDLYLFILFICQNLVHVDIQTNKQKIQERNVVLHMIK
jgi:hypothetical protein